MKKEPVVSPSPPSDPTPYIKTILGDLLLQLAILQAERDALAAQVAAQEKVV